MARDNGRIVKRGLRPGILKCPKTIGIKGGTG